MTFSKTFNVPASKKNNQIFKHYYNFDIDNGFDARFRVDATLEINSLPFKKGNIRLEGVKMQNERAYSYRITFFGNTVVLKDILGSDKISDLQLDAYKEALSHFPSNVDRLYSENGEAQLMKTDVFKGVMYYMYSKRNERGKVIALDIEKVAEIKALNKNNEKPYDLSSMQPESVILANEPDEVGFESVNDVIELPMDKPQRGKRGRKDVP